MRAIFYAVLALWTWAPASTAQLIPPSYDKRIAVGARVRFQHPDSARTVEGEIRWVDGDRVEVLEKGGRFTLTTLRDLETIQIHERGSGLTIGFGALGFVTGSALYLNWCSQNRAECRSQDRDDNWDGVRDDPSMFSIMAVGTTMLFGLVGYAITPPTWQSVRVQADLVPGLSSHRLGLGLRFRL